MENAAQQWFEGFNINLLFVNFRFKKPAGWPNTSTKEPLKEKKKKEGE